MADQNKFEKMLELLINEDKDAAEALFHEIVVEKSRSIYESLLEDEADIEEESDEEVDEAADEDDDEEMDEGFDLDQFEVEADDDMGGDPTDDMLGDLGMDDEEGDDMDMDMGDEGDEDDMEDRVEDLEDALEDLKAEFEKMMAGDEGEDDDMDMDDEEGEEKESFAFESDDDEEVDEAADEDDDEVEESNRAKSAAEQMREYVEKVAPAKMGDNGTNTKSAVASKNDMGGTTANIAKSGVSKGEGTKGGLAAPTPKDMNTKNVNVPGAKGATKMSNQPGPGAEKKGKPETADKSAGSMLNGAPKRAK